MGAPGSTGDKCGSADDKPGSADNKSGSAGNKSGSADDKPGSADEKPGSADDKPGSTWERQRQAWKHLESLYSSLGKMTSLGTLQVRLEIIATTYHATIFETHVFSLYSPLYSYLSTHSISGLAAGGA